MKDKDVEFIKTNGANGPKLFTLYRGETPVKYYYGTSHWPLWLGDEGYDTPEEAKAAWEREENNNGTESAHRI